MQPPFLVYRVDEASCMFGTVSAKGEYREKSNFLELYVDGDNLRMLQGRAMDSAGLFKNYFSWCEFHQNCLFYTVESLLLRQNFF